MARDTSLRLSGEPVTAPRRGRGRLAPIVVLVVALLAAAFWAGRVTVGSAVAEPAATSARLTARVENIEVGRSITLMTTVTRSTTPVAANALVGTVTSVREAGEVGLGDEIYAVDAVPVRVVAGDSPFYRDLAPEATGDDVRRLQEVLRDLGHLRRAPTGTFDAATETAVKAWQRAQHREQTGVVRFGELVAVPTLPAVISLDEEVISAGRHLAGGEMGILTDVGEPVFRMKVNDAQSRMIPTDAAITVQSGEAVWPAVITESAPDDTGLLDLTLRAPDGGPVCGGECDSLGGGEIVLLTQVTLVPASSGPGVPLSAVTTDVDGRTTVEAVGTGADGATEVVPVTVLGVQDGVAVVEGIDAGREVLLPASAAAGEAPATDPAETPPASGDPAATTDAP